MIANGASHRSFARTLKGKSIFRLKLLLVALMVTVASINAQNSSNQGTPAESKTGQAGASTYARDKIETVNLANGNLSLSIPLATVGGRGSAGFTIALSYNSKVWTSEHDIEDVTLMDGLQEAPPEVVTGSSVRNLYTGVYDKPEEEEPGLAKLGGGWTVRLAPGLKALTFGINPANTSGCSFGSVEPPKCGYRFVLTKMWLMLPDGSQMELRDRTTQGTPAIAPVSNGYYQLIDRDRGRVWQSIDGSGVIFVRDPGYPVGLSQTKHYPSGWVFLPDGTRMRIVEGVASKIIDRNGNFINIATGSNVGSYTDELGRQTQFSGSADTMTVTVMGYMGTLARSTSINIGTVGDLDNLRADFRSLPRPFTTGDSFTDALGNYSEHTIQTSHTDLFNHSEGYKHYGSAEGEDVGARRAVTQLNLLDGRSLRFRYNQYGEVAEIVYPGGGISQIDYAGAPTGQCQVGSQLGITFNRRVSQRRTLSDPETTWVYAYGADFVDGVSFPMASVAAHEGNVSGPLLASETHFFLKLGPSGEYRTCQGNIGTGNEKWENAKEFRTEVQTGTGTTVTKRNWAQRAPLVWVDDGPTGYLQTRGQDQSPNDQRVTWEETILEDGKVKRVEYAYDQFNNITSTKEYDFGTSGAPGLLLRETVRKYGADIGGNYGIIINGYCYSNLNPSDSTCGNGIASDVSSIIYQPRLLVSETVKDGYGNQQSYSEFEHDNYSSAPNHAAVVVNGGMIQYDGTQFSSFPSAAQPRGNVTKITRWLSGGTDVVAYSQYDNAGHAIWNKDPNGNVSTVSYADNFGHWSGPGLGGPNGPTFAFPSLATNAAGHVVRMQTNYALGAVSGVKDANNVVTVTEYDTKGRPVEVITALGLPEQSTSQMSYPTLAENSARVSKQLDATRWLTSKTDFDGFDRPKTSWQSEDGQNISLANFTIRTNTKYDGLGRVKQVSNSYRPATEIAIYTTSVYDLAGRVVSVTTPDSAVVTTSYVANTVTVTDQTQKQRKTVTDGLGRLVQVYEAPNDSNYNHLTSYNYDTLDNLIKVTQGSQTREFAYDSLKRLKWAKNPESGRICYGTVVSDVCQANGYDANGNLIYKTDARLVRSTYTYDALNRNTSVSYSNDPAGTPAVYRYYDGWRDGSFTNIQNVKGRLWQTETSGTSGSRTTINNFDAFGHALSVSQQFYVPDATNPWSHEPFTTFRTYNLGGAVTSQTYPSGRTATYAYDAAGRTSSFSGNLGGGAVRTYSSEIIYSPLGAITKEKFGTDTAIYNKLFYNSRGQLAEIREGTTYTGPTDTDWQLGAIINFYGNCWGMCGGQNSQTSMPENNGNLRRQEIYIPGGPTFTQTFAYDSLNRLQRVTEGSSWQQEYLYDSYGNRTINASATSGGVNNRSFEVETATNRLLAPGDSALTGTSLPQRKMRYDDAGNLTNDSWSSYGSSSPGVITRNYDAENRMTAALDSSGGTSYYTYNADGQRVRRKIGAAETWQVYGMDGELLAEYANLAAPVNPKKEYGYRNGQLLITAESTPPINVALSANGGTAVASSYFSDWYWGTFLPSYVNDGLRRSINNAVWADNTHHTFPDWIEVDFNGSKTINEIDIITQQDQNPVVEPTLTQTFSLYGATGFRAEYWNGSAWVDVPGINVTANNKVWRQFTFAAITTSKIKVWVNGGADNAFSRMVEVEAWTAASAAPNINWLVTDQLGTPRMIFDKTGALATTKRHDYLPFGEEIFAGTGGRTTTQGYSVGDDVRQKFTSKERDNETGLDYFLARYYSSTQGRFTSPDKPFADQFQTNPQSWNTYSYVRNSPCNNIDAKGRCSAPSGLKQGQVGICIEAFIAAKTFKKIGGGNNRPHSGDNKDLTSKFRTDIIIAPSDDPNKFNISQTTEAGRSNASGLGVAAASLAFNPVVGIAAAVGVKGTAETTLNGVKPGSDGSSQTTLPLVDGVVRFNVSTTAVNGLNSVSPIDQGSIRSSFNIEATPSNGQVQIDANSEASGYPSFGVWRYHYQDGKLITNKVWTSNETSPAALHEPMKPIPDQTRKP